MKKNYKWTKEKEQLLIELYPIESWDVLIEMFNPLSKDSLVHKAKSLNVSRRIVYTKEEVDFLKENYHTMSARDISKTLGKTESAILSKAYKLGINKMEFWSEEEIKLLKENYNIYSTKELTSKFFPNRTPKAVETYAIKFLGLNKDKYLYDKYKKETYEKLLEDLVAFAKELGRTPTSREVQKNSKLAGAMSYKRYFGSYSNACKEAGLEVNSIIYGRSFHVQSKNGDVCLSKKEKEITDLLIDNNISYEKEVLYKNIINDESMKNIRCDWLINGDVVVEYFGMSEKEYYKVRMDEKISLCKNIGIKLISLERKDIRSNFKGLINKFKEYDIDIKVV